MDEAIGNNELFDFGSLDKANFSRNEPGKQPRMAGEDSEFALRNPVPR